ncbi:35647_t:CDS:1, partial [Racocetra persica]
MNPSNTATRSASQRPTVLSTAQQPKTLSTAQQPTVPLTAQQQTVPLTAQQQTVPLTAQQPTVPLTAQQPIVPLTAQQPIVPLTAQQPTVCTNVTQQPAGVCGISAPQAPCFGRGRGRGRGFTSGGPGLFEVSPEGEVLHEGIPQSKELEHLAQLKEVASEHTRQESLGAYGIPKGSAASLA